VITSVFCLVNVAGLSFCEGAILLPLNTERVHIGDEPDLGATRFVDWGAFIGTTWEIQFSLPVDPVDAVLFVESFDTEAPPDFEDKLVLNGTFIDNLSYAGPPSWYTSAQTILVPATILHVGLNTLRIESGYGQGIYDSPTYDDFGVGQINLSYSEGPASGGAVPELTSLATWLVLGLVGAVIAWRRNSSQRLVA